MSKYIKNFTMTDKIKIIKEIIYGNYGFEEKKKAFSEYFLYSMTTDESIENICLVLNLLLKD